MTAVAGGESPTALPATSTVEKPIVAPTAVLLSTSQPIGPTQSTVATVQSVPTVIPDADLPGISLDIAYIENCRISGDLSESGFSGQGTAPAPTPTPAPADSFRPPYLVERELMKFAVQVTPIADALGSYNSAFQEAWVRATAAEKQAAQLHTYGNLLARLCSAVSQLDIPPEVFTHTVGLSESIRARHSWTIVATDELLCCGNGHTAVLDVGYISTSFAINRAISRLAEYFAAQSLSQPEGVLRVVTNDRLGFSMEIPLYAVVVRNEIDSLVALDSAQEILDPASFGPVGWNLGSSVRVRRIRNGSDLSVSQAVVEYEAILARFGPFTKTSILDIPDLDELQFTYSLDGESWSGLTIIFVLDGHTYFVEMMCDDSEQDVCEGLRSSIESIRLMR